jgi:hypothetical protein
MAMADESIYAQIADELEHGTPDRALWTRATADSDGNADKTKAVYIRLRLADLKRKQAAAAAESLQLAEPPPQAPADPYSPQSSAGISTVRAELAASLLRLRKSSFYTVLQLTPEASDADVRDAIEEYQEKIQAGQAKATDAFTFARDTLGNPTARAAYDRRLLAQLEDEVAAPPAGPRSRQRSSSPAPVAPPPFWQSRYTTAIVATGVVAVLAFLVLSFYKERGAIAAKKAAIEAQALKVNREADNDATRTTTERALVDGVVKNVDRRVEVGSQLANRSIDLQMSAEQRRRQEMEMRAIQEAQRREDMKLAQEQRMKEQQQQQAEERRNDAEKRYWACMNAALDRMSSADANARCGGYRR